MLSAEALKSIIQSETPQAIKAMREDHSAYIRHVFGTGTDEYLSMINEYENKKQHDLRKKHAIRNPWIIDELVRPVDFIWQAKGGDESYVFKGPDKSEYFREKLLDVRGGMSMQQFMKEIWFQRFLSDPNGIIFLEVEKNGTEAHFTYKSIQKIHNYETKGIKIEWIVFEPGESVIEKRPDENGKEQEVKSEYSWAVDERYYYYCKNNGKEFVVEQVLEHNFGMVPGVVNSPIYNTDKGFKVSLIDKQIDLLNSYLTKNSIKEIYQFKHNYPVYWAYETLCPTCNGKRKVGNEVCGTCGGTGFLARKDVADVLILEKPEPDKPIISSPAGYIQPPVETCKENREELDWMFNKTFHSLWGTTTDQMGNETATGKFIDTMPVYNKLNSIADIAQNIQKQLTLIFGLYWFPVTLSDVKISYSRRYIIESPDALWKRYQEARGAKAPEMALNYMLEQFYYSEFASNQTMADYYIKMMYVEPYVHKTIDEVNMLTIRQEIKDAKTLFPQWQKSLDEIDVANKDADKLISELMAYSAANKLIAQNN